SLYAKPGQAPSAQGSNLLSGTWAASGQAAAICPAPRRAPDAAREADPKPRWSAGASNSGYRRQSLSRTRSAADRCRWRFSPRASRRSGTAGAGRASGGGMESPLNKPLALAMVAVALVIGLVVGRIAGIGDGIFGPDPKTIASASLQSMRAQNRLSVFAARYISVVTTSEQRLGGLVSSERTLILPG